MQHKRAVRARAIKKRENKFKIKYSASFHDIFMYLILINIHAEFQYSHNLLE